MITKAIYYGTRPLTRVYRNGVVIFQSIPSEPIEFHVVEDGKLIILGAVNANSLPDGLYLDCAPEWIFPVQNGKVLILEQVYSATQNGKVLEVE
jgi:hypothetical protein